MPRLRRKGSILTDGLSVTYLSGDHTHARSVSSVLLHAELNLPVVPGPLLADWHRDVREQLCLEPGDIEPLSLARTRLRWPELRCCTEAVAAWLEALGLDGLPGDAELALMASRGTPYHHDGAYYGDKIFCNVFLTPDGATDLHFPASGRRLTLSAGTAVIFDPSQPHAIVRRGASRFDPADFASGQCPPQVFLTWELPVAHQALRQALGITLSDVPASSPLAQAEQVWRGVAPLSVCPQTGAWRQV